MRRNVWAVIRREYLQRVRSRAFVIGTIAVPAIMFGLTVVPMLLSSRRGNEGRHIAIVDRTGALAARVEPELAELGWTVDTEPWSDGVEDQLRRKVEARDITGFVVMDDETLANGVATFETLSSPTPVRSLTLRGAITRAALEQRLQSSGGAADLASGGELRVRLLSGEAGIDPDDNQAKFFVAFFGAMLLYMVILVYSVAVMRATLEEKTSRIVEVIISSMEPWHLLLGKIIGVGGVSLTQLAIWIGAGALAAAAGIPTLMTARPDLTGLVDLQSALPGLGMLVLFVGFFLGGFFMFSGIYAAVGSMVSTDEEANQVQFPVVAFLVGPVMMLASVIQDPTATWATVASLFPLFSPILMWGRVVAGGAPAWQVALSFVLMALTVVAIAWIAGRIYRVGILMTGKRPTLPELWRWVRA